MGVDVGKGGALAIYDADAGTLFDIWDMPVYDVTVGKAARKMVDPNALMLLMDMAANIGVQLVCIELVTGFSKDGAGSMFSFGTSYGYTIMAAVAAKIPYERINAATWKSKMKVGRADDDILRVACEHFPHSMPRFYGPRGAIKHDRCEASLLAKYAAIVRLDIIEPNAAWQVQLTTENRSEDRRSTVSAGQPKRRKPRVRVPGN